MNRKKAKQRPALRRVAEARLPTRFGFFRILGLEGRGGQSLVALVKGNPRRRRAPLVRIHSQCLTGDVLMSTRCDCRAQLELALETIARKGAGVLIYEPQEGRGIGLLNKLKAYELQDAGMDTVEANRHLGFPADRRDYSLAGSALRFLGLTSVRLLSNNPDKVRALESAGIRVVERVPCQPAPARGNRSYLRVKKEKMGHLLAL
ncbi:MAG TPA: GTP cyclohydrolase II [Candidatus Acidoferrales bacterium]|nr:GTP cyclohydrolase II [Candidatus Acidoferrales bacterium]